MGKCSVRGCPNLADPRWYVHVRDDGGGWRIVQACDGHGCVGGRRCECESLDIDTKGAHDDA